MNYRHQQLSASQPSSAIPSEQSEVNEADLASSGSSHSRRKVLKRMLLAGAGASAAALVGPTVQPSPLLADSTDQTNNPPFPPMPFAKPGQKNIVPTSAATPGTNYLMFSGLDFKPLVSTTTYSYLNFSGVYATASYNYFVTTVTLPQKATITELEFYYTHNVAGTDYFYLSIVSPVSGGESAYASATTASNDPNVLTIPVNIPTGLVVDNTVIKYVLYWLPSGTGASEVLYGARLGYKGGLGRFGG